MGIMSLLEKQRKDLFRFQLQACSYRVENPIANWGMDKMIMLQSREDDEIDSELDYGTLYGRSAEVNSEHINSSGRPIQYLHRELT